MTSIQVREAALFMRPMQETVFLERPQGGCRECTVDAYYALVGGVEVGPFCGSEPARQYLRMLKGGRRHAPIRWCKTTVPGPRSRDESVWRLDDTTNGWVAHIPYLGGEGVMFWAVEGAFRAQKILKGER